MMQAGLKRWADIVQRRAWVIVVLALGFGGLCLWYAAGNVRINTDTTDMLSAELDFRINDEAMRQAFPQTSGLIVVVAESKNATSLGLAADALADATGQSPEIFGTVFDPASDPFFRKNGLLYRDLDQLDALSGRLSEAQPLIAGLNRNPNFLGLAQVLSLVSEVPDGSAEQQDLMNGLVPLITVLNSTLSTSDATVDWQTLLDDGGFEINGLKTHFRIITVKPPRDLGSLSPASKAMNSLKGLIADLGEAYPDVQMRLTGSVPLAEDELKSVADGMGLAGLLSVALVILVLYIGIRSWRLSIAMMVTLAFGLVVTAAFAVAALPALNLISVAFAVLFVGLSVDFGIHLIMRFREAQQQGQGTGPCLSIAICGVGPAIALGALTSAIGFLSFLPTDYLGLAELGLIAGVGMGVALVANVTVLPALISVMPPKARPMTALPWIKPQAPSLKASNPKPVLVGAVIVGLVSLGLATQARFDFDPLNLKDPDSQSVETLKRLMADETLHPYRIRVLTDSLDSATALKQRLVTLPEVKSVQTLHSFVPEDQADKLDLIIDLEFLIGPSLVAEQPATAVPVDAKGRAEAIARTINALDKIVILSGDEGAAGQASRLRDRLQALLDQKDRSIAERRLFQGLPALIASLREALGAEEFGLGDLPDDVVAQYLAPSGLAKVVVIPSGDMNDPTQVRVFAEAVSAIAPQATGEPIIITEASRAVIDAFWQAGLIAVSLIAVVLGLVLRSLRLIAVVFAPLVLAAMVTTAITVVFGISFNFANIIVLPLLFGLGVDGAIHMVLRARDGKETENLEATSTPQAVVYSFLTTIGSFGSIALSAHPGTASMGLLLSIAVAATLISTLVLLPRLVCEEKVSSNTV